MTEQTADPVRAYVADKIKTAGWGPFDAIAYAKDREKVSAFRSCVMLVRLCGDEQGRQMPEHALIHQATGMQGCAGPQLVVKTAESLGISDDRAAYLVAQLDAELAALAGLTGS